MPKSVQVLAGNNIVEAAIREGKFPESRRAHYLALMAKNPKKTAKLIAKLEGGLLDYMEADDEEERQAVHEAFGDEAQAARVGSRAAPGPSDYPKEWLGPAVAARVARPAGGSPITMENEQVAAQCMPGANVGEIG